MLSSIMNLGTTEDMISQKEDSTWTDGIQLDRTGESKILSLVQSAEHLSSVTCILTRTM
jgi:hypothetical protein